MGTTSMTPGQAMYVASMLDKSWLRNEQRKLYQRSQQTSDYVFCKLWGLITDPRNLRNALARVARNRGHRTAGVDGQTVARILSTQGADDFLAQVRAQLRSGAFVPSPARRVLIPKAGQPGKFRPLGIPTVKDRVVQAAVKNILEPIFEADFYPVSYGFRPGKSVHGALEHLRMLLRPKYASVDGVPTQRLPYQGAIEGDIKGCFDNIHQHALMERIRKRVGDLKVTRLLRVFLGAGILSEGQFYRTPDGTPQGGILSPLLANIALSAIEERYQRHLWPRSEPTPLTDPKAIQKRAESNRGRDRAKGLPIFFPIRYADDFLILVSVPPGPDQQARALEAARVEKAALAQFLREQLHLELSEQKTLVTDVTQPMKFLGHSVRARAHPSDGHLVSAALIPRDRSQRLRELIKAHFSLKTTGRSLEERLKRLNPVLRGWSHFYRHAWGAKRVFGCLDNYLWWTVFRWLRKKHARISKGRLIARYGRRKPGRGTVDWREGDTSLFRLSTARVEYFRMCWLKVPDFAQVYGEPGA